MKVMTLFITYHPKPETYYLITSYTSSLQLKMDFTWTAVAMTLTQHING